MRILITGGSGFIGSAVIRHLIGDTDVEVVNVDKLTYAASPAALAEVADDPRYHFIRADICDRAVVETVFRDKQPDAVMHLAAESHVDRSIDGPAEFIRTNIIGTFTLLEAALAYWRQLDRSKKQHFRFHHVSTDEVYGSLGEEGFFSEETPYAPNSPYAASKASSDHLVRAWRHTYGLPIVISNCSNNYGPFQFPEKLIPLMILNALEGQALPVYGDGGQVRDWLHVEDHARALRVVLFEGRIGESYNIGGNSERRNIDIVRLICAMLDELRPNAAHRPHADLITFVTDRPGHDRRYAIDASKIRRELNWRPAVTFEAGLRRTVEWYLANRSFWEPMRDDAYRRERLGLGRTAA